MIRAGFFIARFLTCIRNGGMSMRVRTYGKIDEAGPGRWDELVASCGAPLFYRSAFLRAFERFPLHSVQAHFYIVGEDAQGGLVFATPVYLLKGVDPMKILNNYFADYGGELILVNHVWHCYDTWIPARGLDPDVVGAVLWAMEALAADLGVALWGFTNVDGTGELSRALTAAGMVGVQVEERFLVDLTPIPDIDRYLALLNQPVRQNLRRYMRIAERAGIVAQVAPVEHADLDGFVALARAGAAKYGNADYYRPGIFEDFLRALGGHVRVFEQRLEGRLIGSTVLLVDETTLHWWVAGNDYTAVPQISPFYLAFLAAIKEAMATGKVVVEAGRRNPRFKTRHGLRPRPVQSHFLPTFQRAVEG
ncbi:GNAT family N-acetyltransferase [Ensifer sp. LBL]|uniref:GNAT family N-acetyltransferase n=1 Tax=Ensifer sp. LBL TaxID=2991056 RepID=UPI003D1D009A